MTIHIGGSIIVVDYREILRLNSLKYTVCFCASSHSDSRSSLTYFLFLQTFIPPTPQSGFCYKKLFSNQHYFTGSNNFLHSLFPSIHGKILITTSYPKLHITIVIPTTIITNKKLFLIVSVFKCNKIDRIFTTIL